MFSVERRKRGVDEETRVGTHACIMVAGRRAGEMEREGRRERHGYIDRGEEEMGVMIRRVRTRSRGARRVAAMAVAATATPSDVNGFGLSSTSRPPIPLPAAPTSPGSGMFSNAEIRLLNQPSVVFSRKL
jgi:hypothetical protein